MQKILSAQPLLDLRKQHKTLTLKDCGITHVLAFDPGQTTGFALLDVKYKKITATQLKTQNLHAQTIVAIQEAIEYIDPEKAVPLIRIEDYRIYSWKSQYHNWQDLHTAKLIGLIIGILSQHFSPIVADGIQIKSAQSAKQFATDKRLKELQLYIEGMPHARDALRHLVTSTVFY